MTDIWEGVGGIGTPTASTSRAGRPLQHVSHTTDSRTIGRTAALRDSVAGARATLVVTVSVNWLRRAWLTDVQIGKTRVRQHVNPLSRENYKVTASPDWPALYRQTAAPLVLDLGCGPGRFLLLMHQRRRQGRLNLPSLGETQQPVNYLGLEIRRPVRANNLLRHFFHCKHSSAPSVCLSFMCVVDPSRTNGAHVCVCVCVCHFTACRACQ